MVSTTPPRRSGREKNPATPLAVTPTPTFTKKNPKAPKSSNTAKRPVGRPAKGAAATSVKAPPPPPKGATPAEEADVGARVACYWEAERKWFKGILKQGAAKGTTKRAPQQNKKLFVLYDDGETEEVSGLPDPTVVKLPTSPGGKKKDSLSNKAIDEVPAEVIDKVIAQASVETPAVQAPAKPQTSGEHGNIINRVFRLRGHKWVAATALNIHMRYDDGTEETVRVPDVPVVTVAPTDDGGCSTGGGRGASRGAVVSSA